MTANAYTKIIAGNPRLLICACFVAMADYCPWCSLCLLLAHICKVSASFTVALFIIYESLFGMKVQGLPRLGPFGLCCPHMQHRFLCPYPFNTCTYTGEGRRDGRYVSFIFNFQVSAFCSVCRLFNISIQLSSHSTPTRPLTEFFCFCFMACNSAQLIRI